MITRKNLDRRTLAYMYHNMYDRCYREDYLKKHPQYRGCSVCEEWLNNRESFYNWVAENYYIIEGEQIDLDKDILVKGNKVYSPDTCIFVPHVINVYYENLTRNPVQQKNGKWRIDICIDGKTIPLGTFDTEEEAKLEFVKHKTAAIISKADAFKGRIPEKLYETMLQCKIELSDWK